MIDMALLSVIRRWALREELSIREISRRTSLSRNTIRKYLRGGAVEPKFNVPVRPSKLDAFVDKLSHWLKVEAGRSRTGADVLPADEIGQLRQCGAHEMDLPLQGR